MVLVLENEDTSLLPTTTYCNVLPGSTHPLGEGGPSECLFQHLAIALSQFFPFSSLSTSYQAIHECRPAVMTPMDWVVPVPVPVQLLVKRW